MAKTTFAKTIEAELAKMNTNHTTEEDPRLLSLPGDVQYLIGNSLREPEGRMTLLPTPDRKPLPERTSGRISQLEQIIEYCPEVYVELLMTITRGVFYHVASESVGIASTTFYNWLEKGKVAIGRGEDSVYNRFRRDVQRAAARARVGAEIAIASTNPQRWLSHGPGRSLGNQWSESNGKNNEKDLESTDSIGELIVELPQLESKGPTDSSEITKGQITFAMDASTELAVIDAEESAGIFKYTEAYKESLRDKAEKELKK